MGVLVAGVDLCPRPMGATGVLVAGVVGPRPVVSVSVGDGMGRERSGNSDEKSRSRITGHLARQYPRQYPFE